MKKQYITHWNSDEMMCSLEEYLLSLISVCRIINVIPMAYLCFDDHDLYKALIIYEKNDETN